MFLTTNNASLLLQLLLSNFEGCDFTFHIIQKFTVFPKTVS